jgi:hypothetical protein
MNQKTAATLLNVYLINISLFAAGLVSLYSWCSIAWLSFITYIQFILQMMDLFLWLVTVLDARVGAALVAIRFFVGSHDNRFFVGSKPNDPPNYVDRACQTDTEEVGKILEGEHEFSFKDLEEEGLQGSAEQKTKGVNPYSWDYAYWPSEGGV